MYAKARSVPVIIERGTLSGNGGFELDFGGITLRISRRGVEGLGWYITWPQVFLAIEAAASPAQPEAKP